MSEPADEEVPRAKSRRVKRKKVQASNGWTIVTHGETTGGVGVMNEEGLLQEAKITKTVDGLTVPKLLNLFSVMTGRWKETRCAQEVEEMIGKRRWDLREALCIGIGSFSLDWEHRHRSMWQLVLFLGVVDMGTCYHYDRIQSDELINFHSIDKRHHHRALRARTYLHAPRRSLPSRSQYHCSTL
jgi:hypothetical protein